ncbi:MAG: hypothetical protein IKN21_00790, partial [Prevotella sp.]|nr:hypothetical protein [Prevotella sp.]
KGLKKICGLDGTARLIPFEFNTEQIYLICLTDSLCKIYKNDVLVTHWKDIDDGKSMRVYEIIDGKDTGEYHDYINHEVWWDEVTFNSNGVVTINNSSLEPYGGTFVTSDGVMTITDSSNGKVYQIPYEIKDGILIFTADQRKVYRDQGYSYLTITHYQRENYPYK